MTQKNTLISKILHHIEDIKKEETTAEALRSRIDLLTPTPPSHGQS